MPCQVLPHSNKLVTKIQRTVWIIFKNMLEILFIESSNDAVGLRSDARRHRQAVKQVDLPNDIHEYTVTSYFVTVVP